MALTDTESAKKEKRNKRRSVEAKTNYRWSDQQKLEAVSSWLALGNLAMVSRILSIPEITLRVWKTSEWWAKAVEEIRLSENVQLSARMKKLVEASHVIVAQRLETGDPILNQKTGEIIYKPVNLRDAHRVAVDLIDRQKEVDKLTRDTAPSEERDDDKLAKLAERFAEMATMSIEKQFNKRRTVDAVDNVEDVHHAAYDARQARLPESFGVGEEESAGTAGPTSAEQQGSEGDDQTGESERR